MNFKQELEALLAAHNIDGALFVVVNNADKGRKSGDLVVSVEACISGPDVAAGTIVLACKDAVEAELPNIFGNARKVRHD